MPPHVLCSISTRGRYRTTLPLAIQSVLQQTRLPDQLVIYDDNDQAEDLRTDPVYQQLFQLMAIKGVQWEWTWSLKKGQHHNHQMANLKAREWVWRVDDDCMAEPHVLETLLHHVNDQVAGVGGSVLTPHWDRSPRNSTGAIDQIDSEPCIQWGEITQVQQVDHLHCSFLYRAHVHDYHLGLSRVAHREETLFTWGLKQKGWQLLVVPQAVTWHLKSEQGGIRSETNHSLYDHDNQIFHNFLKHRDRTIVVLDNGMGDHVVFKHVLPKLKNPLVFSCYPEIIPGHSIQEAKDLFGDLSMWSVYKKMSEWKWQQSLESAYLKLYNVE